MDNEGATDPSTEQFRQTLGPRYVGWTTTIQRDNVLIKLDGISKLKITQPITYFMIVGFKPKYLVK